MPQLLKVVTALTDLCVLLTVVFERTPGSQAAARDRDALRTELAVPCAPAAGLPCSGGTFPSPLLGKKGCPQSHPEGKIKQGNKAGKLSNWCGLAQLRLRILGAQRGSCASQWREALGQEAQRHQHMALVGPFEHCPRTVCDSTTAFKRGASPSLEGGLPSALPLIRGLQQPQQEQARPQRCGLDPAEPSPLLFFS